MLLTKEILIIISLISLITFLGSLILIPLIIINLSPEYFSSKRRSMINYKNPVIRYLVLILKNILGFFFIILGIIMLFIPGQGLLSITIGIFFINFPGKKRLEYIFFSNPKINKAINHIRRKAGKQELRF